MKHPVGSTDDPQDDAQAMRRCVRDLVALSTLPAVWSHSDQREITEGLSRVLTRSLPISFVYVRTSVQGGTDCEVARTSGGPATSARAQEIGRLLEPVCSPDAAVQVPTMVDPDGDEVLRLAVVPIGYQGDCGMLVVGAAESTFPNQTDRLLLGVAANQAAIVLQHRQLESGLLRRERELTDFFDNAPMGLHWVAGDGTILRVNQAELEMLGYSREEYLGRDIAEFHADVDSIDDMLRRLREGEQVDDWEAQLRCRDGTFRDVLISSNTLWEDGNLVHTRCFTRDVTEQRRVQLATALLGAIVDSSDDAIVSKDLNGTITSWNSGAERLFGYSSAEAIGKPVTMLIPPDRLDEEPRILERLRRGERMEHFETIRVRKDGTRRDISLTISPVRAADGTIVGASKIARDITGRKRAELALRKQTERLHLLCEVAAVLLSADEPDIMLRELFAEIGAHVGADAYLNHMVDEQDSVLCLASSFGMPADSLEAIARVRFGEGAFGTAALQAKPIVGTELASSVGLRAFVCHPLVLEGRVIGTLAFASRSKDEFDRDELGFLDTICRYVTMAFERLRLMSAMKLTDRRKDQFLATLAHELRNPLAPVRTAVALLRLKGPNEPELQLGRDVIDRQVQHLARLIDDLMDIARITRNKLELRKSPVSLAAVLADAVETSRPIIDQFRHELTVSLPAQPVMLDGDSIRLAQVFTNLLNNAAKYTNPGGRIWLTGEMDGVDIVVRVRDNGVGVPRGELTGLFEMFYQGDDAHDRARGGLGIGLSLVRGLVDLHGGRVDAFSEGVGMGSEFVVRLPVLKDVPIAAVLAGADASVGLASTMRRILVVDDNEDAADTLALLLRHKGHEVETAYDGLAGVAAAERFRPEVVLLDIGMPNLNGREVCRRIRQTPWGSSVFLVAVTGWGQEDDRRQTAEAGFDGHVVKPVDPAAILEVIDSLSAKRVSPTHPQPHS